MTPKFKIGDTVEIKTGFTFEVSNISISILGILYSGESEVQWYNEENLVLYVEPKKKVKKYLYAYKTAACNEPTFSKHFYNDDSKFSEMVPITIWFQRLDWSMIEVEAND